MLWPRLELYFAQAAHPLRGEALDAAKASLGLAQELFVAYKRVLEHEANKRVHFGGSRTLVTLIHRCLQCAWRILVNSYIAVRADPAADVARYASHLCVRARTRTCTSARYPPTSPR